MDNSTDLARSLGRVEGKIDMLLESEQQRSAAAASRDAAIERRVRNVESSVSRAYGLGAGFMLTGTFVGYVWRAVTGGH